MKFSIITITNNRAHLIADTLKSVLEQTYEHFEHIIIDDGSTDATENEIKKLNDDRIKYFYYNKHPKRSFLRNEGIRKATGDIICILDSDDLWKKEKLETLYHIFTKYPNIVWATHNVLVKVEHKKSEHRIYDYKEDFTKIILPTMLSNKFLPYPFYSFKKSVLQSMSSFNETMVDGQHDFFLRMAANYPIYYCAKILGNKKQHQDNISNKKRVSGFLNYSISLHNLFESRKISKADYTKAITLNYFKTARFYEKEKNTSEALAYYKKTKKEASIVSNFYIKSVLYAFKLQLKYL